MNVWLVDRLDDEGRETLYVCASKEAAEFAVKLQHKARKEFNKKYGLHESYDKYDLYPTELFDRTE